MGRIVSPTAAARDSAPHPLRSARRKPHPKQTWRNLNDPLDNPHRGVAITFGVNAVAHDAPPVLHPRDLGIGRVIPGSRSGGVEQRPETEPLQALGLVQSRPVGNSGIDIHQLDRAVAGRPIPLGGGIANDQRCPGRRIEQELLLPLPVFPSRKPWSLQKTTKVLSASPRRSSASNSRPTCASTKLTAAK